MINNLGKCIHYPSLKSFCENNTSMMNLTLKKHSLQGHSILQSKDSPMTIEFISMTFSIVEHIPLPKSGILQFCSQLSHIGQDYASVLTNIQVPRSLFCSKPTSRMYSCRLAMVLFLLSPAICLYTWMVKIDVGT